MVIFTFAYFLLNMYKSKVWTHFFIALNEKAFPNLLLVLQLEHILM